MLYLVKRRIIHDGKVYNPGATIDLDDKAAALMVNGQIVPAEDKKASPPPAPPAPIDYVNAALFLQSRGYKAETPEEAEKFVAGLDATDRAGFLVELAAYEEAEKKPAANASAPADAPGAATANQPAAGTK